MTAPATAERVLCSAHLYRPARNTYQRIFNREYVGYRRAGREFYGQFVGHGDLVFDLGANRGLMAEMFLELGARVIAVEPIPELALTIRRRYPSRALVVEQCAVGDEPGTATLRLGADDLHSSISDEWIERAHADPDIPNRWTESFTVPVRTPDDLIAQYGTPAFMKIDVEGFEPHPVRRPLPAGSGPLVRVPVSGARHDPSLLRPARRTRPLRVPDRRRRAARVPGGGLDGRRHGDGAPRGASGKLPVTHGDVYARLQA